MPIASESLLSVGDLKIWCETFGDAADVPILLINGLGSQCIRWDDEFCQGLADRFFHVIRFDNRDVGLSSRLEGSSDVGALLDKLTAGEAPDAAYTLSDMAADAVGVLDGLEIDSAHVVGMSMGGMIAQVVAIEHPSRVLSMTSIMSNTGNREYGAPTPEALTALLETGPAERDASIEHDLRIGQIWANPEYWNEAYMRDLAERQYDRGNGADKSGVGRQSCAVLASGSREEALAELEVPTLVIHGAMDTLVSPSGGRRTAELVPNATLLMLDEMSHDWPPELFGPIIEAITRHAIAAGQMQ